MSKQTINEHRVTRGEIGLAGMHRWMQHVTFGAAVGLMAASYVSLHWAIMLITGNQIVAVAVPLLMEAGMAATAFAASTIRRNGRGYYYSLWVIFSFVMLLAQVANIGHAVVTVDARMGELPTFVPPEVTYGAAAAFAALFPLGGTMFVHVSGFLRAHSVDSDWVDNDAPTVHVSTTTEPARRAPAARTRTGARTPTPTAPVQPQPAPAAPPAPARPTAPRPAALLDADDDQYAQYATQRHTTGTEMSAKDVAALIGRDPSTGSRRRAVWRDRFDAETTQALDALAAEVRVADPQKPDDVDLHPTTEDVRAAS